MCKLLLSFRTVTELSHTDEGSVQPTQVCGSWPDGECCGWSADIEVKKCPRSDGQDSSYFVYQLTGPRYCDSAYCTRDRHLCERGLECDPKLKKCVCTYPHS